MRAKESGRCSGNKQVLAELSSCHGALAHIPLWTFIPQAYRLWTCCTITFIVPWGYSHAKLLHCFVFFCCFFLVALFDFWQPINSFTQNDNQHCLLSVFQHRLLKFDCGNQGWLQPLPRQCDMQGRRGVSDLKTQSCVYFWQVRLSVG